MNVKRAKGDKNKKTIIGRIKIRFERNSHTKQSMKLPNKTGRWKCTSAIKWAGSIHFSGTSSR